MSPNVRTGHTGFGRGSFLSPLGAQNLSSTWPPFVVCDLDGTPTSTLSLPPFAPCLRRPGPVTCLGHLSHPFPPPLPIPRYQTKAPGVQSGRSQKQSRLGSYPTPTRAKPLSASTFRTETRAATGDENYSVWIELWGFLELGFFGGTLNFL